MFTSLTNRIRTRQYESKRDAGDVVQTVILVAAFSIVAVTLVIWLSSAALNKGVDGGKCIEGAQSGYSGSTTSYADCTGSTASQANNSFTKDSQYTSRY